MPGNILIVIILVKPQWEAIALFAGSTNRDDVIGTPLSYSR